MEREKANLRDWEHGNRTQREWQTMAERATIGDQELSRQTTFHTPNLIEQIGNRSWSGATTAGSKMSIGAGKEEKGGPQGPITPEPIRPTPGRPTEIIEGEIVDPPRPAGPRRPLAITAPPDRGNGGKRGVHIAGPTLPTHPGKRPPVMVKTNEGPAKNPEYTAWQGRRDSFETGVQAQTGIKPDKKVYA
ncbi:MAG: hypothetical protein EBY38_09980 [Flavobacteriaceae bacterium]|nr:hypothetical protein [Flavobacteriaceae bacterium]